VNEGFTDQCHFLNPTSLAAFLFDSVPFSFIQHPTNAF
jgi:hypothetical protein